MTDVRTMTTEPVVGEVYLVPRAYVDHPSYHDYAPPVLSERPHRDPDLDNDVPHYHLDYRFADLAVLARKFPPGQVAGWYHTGATAVRGDLCKVEVRVEPMTCLRPFPQNSWTVTLHEEARKEVRQKGARLSLKCLTCPHRGTPLGSAPRDEDGNHWCPAHGLKFDKDTGEVL